MFDMYICMFLTMCYSVRCIVLHFSLMIVICILNLINCTFNKFVLMCIIYPCLMHFHLIIGVRCMFMDIYYLPICNSILNLLGALLCGCILYLIVYDTCSLLYSMCVDTLRLYTFLV
jgi:hypothetical protein